MYKAKVLKTNEHKMKIEVLDHKNGDNIGDSFTVVNDKRYFDLYNIKIKPTKKRLLELPIGTKITTDSEEYNVFVKTDGNSFEALDGSVICNNDIEDDLTINDEDYGTKILKIEVPTYETTYDNLKEVKEMTIAEISKALGYEVKIVREEE